MLVGFFLSIESVTLRRLSIWPPFVLDIKRRVALVGLLTDGKSSFDLYQPLLRNNGCCGFVCNTHKFFFFFSFCRFIPFKISVMVEKEAHRYTKLTKSAYVHFEKMVHIECVSWRKNTYIDKSTSKGKEYTDGGVWVGHTTWLLFFIWFSFSRRVIKYTNTHSMDAGRFFFRFSCSHLVGFRYAIRWL